jgi:hypothetical protein
VAHEEQTSSPVQTVWEILLLVLLFFLVAGSEPPSINESHYLAKAKHYWDPAWMKDDVFVDSGYAHVTFFATIGLLTRYFSLTTTAWIGRLIGWILLAGGLQRLCRGLLPTRYLSLVVAIVWIVGVQRANLAGEWIVGGIEGKVIAYAFVLFGLAKMIEAKWSNVWILLGLASAFHVLVGGWAVVVAMGVRGWGAIRNGKINATRSEMVALVLGGSISLLGLLPGLMLGSDASERDRAIAAQLYAFGRIRHHLAPASFPLEWFVRHGILIGVTAVGAGLLMRRLPSESRQRFRTAYWFAAGAVILAVLGGVVGLLPGWNPTVAAGLLRFYWFRMTDAFVPLAAGLTVAGWIQWGWSEKSPRPTSPRIGWAVAWIALLTCAGSLSFDAYRRLTNPMPDGLRANLSVRLPTDQPTVELSDQQVYADWLDVCQWARQETPPGSVFITPRHQQTFKWLADRSEVVNWKDVPQDANALLEWARRFNKVFPKELGRRHPPVDADTLVDLGREYGAAYLVVDRRVIPDPLSLPQLYPPADRQDRTYAVYSLKRD